MDNVAYLVKAAAHEIDVVMQMRISEQVALTQADVFFHDVHWHGEKKSIEVGRQPEYQSVLEDEKTDLCPEKAEKKA